MSKKANLVIAEEEIKTYFKIKFENMFDKYRENIISPYNENADENIGGGASNIKHSKEENLAVKLADDKTLKWYKELYEVIDRLYSYQVDENKKVLKAYYLNANNTKHKRYNDEYVAKRINRSVNDVKTVRKVFIEIVAVNRGYFWMK